MIIAECGQNFCGDLDLAHKLIGLAKDNGADLVKFQLYDHHQLYGDQPEIPDVALPFGQAKGLFDYGKDIGIEVFFSVFDIERVKWCEEIGVKRYKVAHSQRHNQDLRNALVGKEIILSTNDIQWIEADNLYCIPLYPTPIEAISFAADYGHSIFDDDYYGFSDHTIGLDAAKIALARGAQIIEKHFCLSHDMGIDGLWSMNDSELFELKRWENVCRQVL